MLVVNLELFRSGKIYFNLIDCTAERIKMIKHHCFKYKIVTLVLMSCIFQAGGSVATGKDAGTNMMVQLEIINAKKYADWQNSSFLPVHGSVNGKELWSSSFPKTFENDPPQHVCVCGGTVLVSFKNGIVAIDAATGAMEWTKNFINTYDFDAGPAGVRIIDTKDAMSLVSFQGKISEPTQLPLFSEIRQVLFVVQNHNEYAYVYNRFPSSFDEPELLEGFSIQRYDYKANKITFAYNDKQTSTCFVLNKNSERCYLATENALYDFPVAIKNENELRKIGSTAIRALSVYGDGSLLLCREAEEADGGASKMVKKIAALTPQGKPLWDLPIEHFSQTNQPVAFAPGGGIYYCAGNELIAIKNGEILWTLELTAGINDTYLTVLDDQSVLVAVLNSMYHVSAGGTLLKKITVPFVITCRPVMDGTGKIYVAGKGAIGCSD